MKTPEASDQGFGKVREFLWPIHRHELYKIVPMLLIFFLITFNYNILRILKDTLVVTARDSGAEAIPFIKVWFMFPCSVLITYLFTKLANRLSRDNVFYIMTGGFLLFFALFAFVLYPNKELLHPDDFADHMRVLLPEGFKGLVAAFRNWTSTGFYVMAELWSNIILTMLLWGFANQVTKFGEARRFYGVFGVGVNFSGIVAGWLSMKFCEGDFNPDLPFGATCWEQTMTILISLVLLSGVAAMVIFWWFNAKILSNATYHDQEEVRKEKATRGKLSMRDSLAFLMKSKYLICIALIVFLYNVVINLVEVVWKFEVKNLYPGQQDYNAYMSQVTFIMGIISTFISLFISGNIIRKLGWSATVMLTPIILLVTSVLFFGSYYVGVYTPGVFELMLGSSALNMLVFFGTFQNILSRAAKYTVFDATREMAFVPLSPTSKVQAKAIVDGVCNRLGKSGGSVLHQSLLITLGSIGTSIPYIGGVLVLIIGVWIVATKTLTTEYKKIVEPTSAEAGSDTNEVKLSEQLS